MQQVKVFENVKDLNLWLSDWSETYEIIDIKFQFTPSQYRYMVWYRKNK